MTIYVVIRRGVYRHEILGLCGTLDSAQALGAEAVTQEHDHYHDAEVVACELGAPGERYLGAVTSTWDNSAGHHYERNGTFSGTKWVPAVEPK